MHTLTSISTARHHPMYISISSSTNNGPAKGERSLCAAADGQLGSCGALSSLELQQRALPMITPPLRPDLRQVRSLDVPLRQT